MDETSPPLLTESKKKSFLCLPLAKLIKLKKLKAEIFGSRKDGRQSWRNLNGPTSTDKTSITHQTSIPTPGPPHSSLSNPNDRETRQNNDLTKLRPV